MVQQKLPTLEISWETIECETLGGTIQYRIHHLGGFIQNRLPKGGVIQNHISLLGEKF